MTTPYLETYTRATENDIRRNLAAVAITDEVALTHVRFRDRIGLSLVRLGGQLLRADVAVNERQAA